MTAKIDKKIVGYKVLTDNDEAQEQPKIEPKSIESVHEKLKRPELLSGSTYKVKTPQSDHALYITVNDIVMNAGTEHEARYPYEVFINSKDMEHFQWVIALTRVISAVFRKGGDVAFLVEELKAVFDPKGGYFKKGGVYMPSLVAEIGHAIEQHLKEIGVIKIEVDESQADFIKAKRDEFEAKNAIAVSNDNEDAGDFPDTATVCPKCSVKAAILMDGCSTCLSCGSSKCG